MGVVERIPNTSNVGKFKEYLKTHDSENVIPEATSPTEQPPTTPTPRPSRLSVWERGWFFSPYFDGVSRRTVEGLESLGGNMHVLAKPEFQAVVCALGGRLTGRRAPTTLTPASPDPFQLWLLNTLSPFVPR